MFACFHCFTYIFKYVAFVNTSEGGLTWLTTSSCDRIIALDHGARADRRHAGVLAKIRPDDLLAEAVRNLMKTSAFKPEQIEDFIVKGVSAIVLNPCDSKAVGTAIRKANAAGILDGLKHYGV